MYCITYYYTERVQTNRTAIKIQAKVHATVYKPSTTIKILANVCYSIPVKVIVYS